jgi:hypothetical protein
MSEAERIKKYVDAVIDVRMMQYNVDMRDCPATRRWLAEARAALEIATKEFEASPVNQERSEL